MRAGRTLVKISISTALACATTPEPSESFGVPSPDTRNADMAAISKSSGVSLRYLFSVELPQGTLEVYQVAEGAGRFLYLPVERSPLLSFATARRFVRPSGEVMTETEARVATELWRLSLDDPRRHKLHELGARVHQERNELALHEWVYLPWRQATEDLDAALAIMARETQPNPEALLERVLVSWARREPALDTEEASLEASALVAGREALSRLDRSSDADVALLIGPVGRRPALRAAAQWLAKARAAAGVSEVKADRASAPLEQTARTFDVSFPVPRNAGRWVNAEMATRWLADRLHAGPSAADAQPPLAVRALRLERADSNPRLELRVELGPTTSSSSAADLLRARLDAAMKTRLERGTRRRLAAAAEAARRARIEGPFPLVFTLLEATLDGELESISRPVSAPRPGAVTTWLESVLRPEAATWSPVTP